MSTRSLFFTLITALTLITTGCSLKYTIDEPAVSHFSYQNVDKKPIIMKVIDQRDDKNFFIGVSNLSKVGLSISNIQEPVPWLAKSLEKEFAARGVPVQAITTDIGDGANVTLTVKKFQIVNHRVTGFSAWESYHLFLGQLSMGTKTCSIPVFFTNSKVPVWSMDEIKKPCLDVPMSVVVKDIVSKINQCAFDYKVSDADVQKMAAAALDSVKPETDNACLPSIELGGTNNPSAITPLKKIAESDDSLVRTCAVSAIGTLGVQNSFDYLHDKFALFSNNDKTMVVKSIGDAKSSESDNFLMKVKGDKLYSDEDGIKYCVDLYLAK